MGIVFVFVFSLSGRMDTGWMMPLGPNLGWILMVFFVFVSVLMGCFDGVLALYGILKY